MKTRKNVTKKLVKYIGEVTEGIFKKSVRQVFGDNLDDLELAAAINDLRSVNMLYDMHRDEPMVLDLMKAKEEVDVFYLESMCQLSSQDLQDIIFLHNHGRFKRASRTLEAITSELTRRALLDDSSQSDAINHHGELNVKKESS